MHNTDLRRCTTQQLYLAVHNSCHASSNNACNPGWRLLPAKTFPPFSRCTRHARPRKLLLSIADVHRWNRGVCVRVFFFTASALSFMVLRARFQQHECARQEAITNDCNTRPHGCAMIKAVTSGTKLSEPSFASRRRTTDFFAGKSAWNMGYVFRTEIK